MRSPTSTSPGSSPRAAASSSPRSSRSSGAIHGKPDGGVHRLLRLARDAPAPAEHAVLADLQALALGHAAHRHVVRLGPGEVVERGAEAVRVDHAQVDLEAGAEQDARPGLALRQRFRHLRIGGEPGHHRVGRLRRHEDVEVADGVAHPPVAAGDLDPVDAAHGAQVVGERPRVLRRDGELEAPRLRQLPLHRIGDLRLARRPEPLQLADAALLGRPEQLRQRLDLEIAIERLDALRPEPGHAQELGHAGRQLLAQALEQLAGPGPAISPILAVRSSPIPGSLGSGLPPPIAPPRSSDQVLDRPRRVAIGAHAKRVRLLDLEEIGDLVEHPRDIGVVHRHGPAILATFPASMVRAHRSPPLIERKGRRAARGYNHIQGLLAMPCRPAARPGRSGSTRTRRASRPRSTCAPSLRSGTCSSGAARASATSPRSRTWAWR